MVESLTEQANAVEASMLECEEEVLAGRMVLPIGDGDAEDLAPPVQVYPGLDGAWRVRNAVLHVRDRGNAVAQSMIRLSAWRRFSELSL
jgi:hypothetical protein